MPIAAFPLGSPASTVDGVVTGLLLLLIVTAVVVVGCLVLSRLRLVREGLGELAEQVGAARAAHDHHVDLLDKRMRSVEASAATAERESRMVTLQLADLNRVMLQQAEVLAAIEDGTKAQRGGTDSRQAATSVPRLHNRGSGR